MDRLIKIISEQLILCKVEPERGLGFTTVSNARELGGLRTADGRTIDKGKLLRTGHLSQLSGEDLRRLEEEYKLSLIVDLRMNKEQQDIPDAAVRGADYLSSSLLESDKLFKGDGHQSSETATKDMLSLIVKYSELEMVQTMIQSMYLGMVSSEYSQQVLSRAIHAILEKKGQTVLWHCTQGKDRCGIMSVMMLGVLGADRTIILEDFAVSNQSYSKLLDIFLEKAREMNASKEAMETIRGMIGAKVSNMELALDWIDNEYGSMQGYLEKALFITKEEAEALKSYYLK